MVRYISEFRLEEEFEPTCNAIAKIITDSGYKYVDYEYEEVFKKGNGLMSAACFIKVSLDEEGNLKIEAWRKNGIGVGVLCGEAKPNREMKKIIKEIESLLTENEEEHVNDGKIVAKPNVEREYPEVEKPCKKKEFLQKHLAPSLAKEYTASAIVVYLLSGFFAITGYVSQDNRYIAFAIIMAIFMVAVQFIKSTLLMRCVAFLCCLPGIMYAKVVYMLFLIYELLNFEIDKTIAVTLILATLLMAFWLTTAIALFVTAHKVDKHYKKIK